MKKKNKHKENRKETSAWHIHLLPETKKSMFAIASFVLTALFVLSYIGKGGNVGGYLYRAFDFLLGNGYFVAPLAFLFIGFSLLLSSELKIIGSTFLGGALFLVASLGALDLFFHERTGGFIGSFISAPLFKLFDFWGSLVILFGIGAASFLLICNVPLWRRKEKKDIDNLGEGGPEKNIVEDTPTFPFGVRVEPEVFPEDSPHVASASVLSAPQKIKEDGLFTIRKASKKFHYQKPPFDLLEDTQGKPSSGDIKANSNIIKRTLENFGVEVEMGEISVGPTVTQYTLKPAEGVKLSRVVALHNDLSLALAAHPIRIEAPIPGKSLVGIEVPNRSIALVGIRALMQHSLFQEATQPLLFSLGRDVAGSPVFADLSRMPHLLISGATGSGKSVCTHAIITSFLYRNPPEILRFLIMDPKRVELSVYNDIPHLLTPVIIDPKTTIQSLRWATKEMDRRYGLLSQFHARDISSYNARMSKESEGEFLPYIVIIIDELADIMARYPRELESSIVRLAQMARAVGIHLIVATQRPSVEVITGLIKANITSRIAFQVASQIDSRTILDASGAEKLLGNGDMLFISGDAVKPRRIQGAYISEQEVKRVVAYLKEESEAPEYDPSIFDVNMKSDSENDDDIAYGDDDPLYDEAHALVKEAGKASASYLQRRLRIGYARAARLLDTLESQGIIGPADGAKPREVYIKTGDEEEKDSREL